MRKRSSVVALLLSLALVGACGSTVSGAARRAANNASGFNVPATSDAGATGDQVAAAAGGDGSSSVTGASGSGGGSSGGFGQTSGSGSSIRATTGSGGSGKIPAAGPGITDSTIYIGLGYSSQSAAGDRAIGAAGAAPSYDARDVYNAAFNYANAHGGYAGRKLVGLYYDYNLTTDASTQDQSACASYTQDHKVFIMGTSGDILNECAEKAHAAIFGSGSAVEPTFKKFPHLIEPESFRFDRLGTATVNGLARAGYFTGKLGLVTWDETNYRYTMDHGYLPALAAKHVSAVDIAYINVPQQIGALGDSSAAVSSAVTKFRSEGIDHIIIQDGPAGVWAGTGLTLQWMEQAKSQHWYPLYGQNTYNSPGWDVLPSDQMDKAIAIDQSDYDAKFDQGWRPNPAREKCFQIMKDAGLPVASSNLNDEGIAGGACDVAFFTQLVINRMKVLSNDEFLKVASGLGTAFNSALVYGTKLIPGRRDGGDFVRTEVYSKDCKCLTYKGPPASSD